MKLLVSTVPSAEPPSWNPVPGYHRSHSFDRKSVIGSATMLAALKLAKILPAYFTTLEKSCSDEPD
ncbi:MULTISPECIES: hypothetical protein [unclassified Microcoleus]|uniref:hypothetical protein n=1 Tax=unclassified Microcoleus TaxID=2642155 RepID=UPI002FCEE74F